MKIFTKSYWKLILTGNFSKFLLVCRHTTRCLGVKGQLQGLKKEVTLRLLRTSATSHASDLISNEQWDFSKFLKSTFVYLFLVESVTANLWYICKQKRWKKRFKGNLGFQVVSLHPPFDAFQTFCRDGTGTSGLSTAHDCGPSAATRESTSSDHAGQITPVKLRDQGSTGKWQKFLSHVSGSAYLGVHRTGSLMVHVHQHSEVLRSLFWPEVWFLPVDDSLLTAKGEIVSVLMDLETNLAISHHGTVSQIPHLCALTDTTWWSYISSRGSIRVE